jgi:hypothetical protein
MHPVELPGLRGPKSWSGRDFLVLVFLIFAAIHCVRSNFFVNESGGVDWRGYASGEAPMPFQGRVGMMPVLQWAEGSSVMVRGAEKYQSMMIVASKYSEPVSVEKFVSMVVGLFSLLALLGYCVWYGRRREFRPWWGPSFLMLLIVTVTLAMRSEHDVWTPYDLPHAALFGIAVMCAFESEWVPMLVLFALDVPVRETSIYLLTVSVPMSWRAWEGVRSRNLRVGLMAGAMGVYWWVWRIAIQRRFMHNPNDAGLHWGANFHELLFPHHWPQILSAGGYLILFVWLERKRLPEKARFLLWCTLVCVPVTLFFGRWGETRIWLEWTLPWALLGATELEQYFLQDAAEMDSAEMAEGEVSARRIPAYR